MASHRAALAEPRRWAPRARAAAVLAVALALAGCAGGPPGARGGRDGAPARPPGNLDALPDAQPRIEPIRASGGTSKPYTVLGRSYVPIADDRAFRESGLASWYGSKFHRQSTASGEPYDMYAMTAAHRTLPLPSYARVRNPANGREVIVRVNDRGPFHEDRVIDLSYGAALKLDLLRGVAPVEIERITNEDIRTGAWQRDRESRGSALAVASPGTAAPPVPSGPMAVAASAPVWLPEALTTPVATAARPDTSELPALPDAAARDKEGARSLPRAPDAAVATRPAPVEGGFWVQLGAFSRPEGAAGFQQRVARELPALAGSLNVFSEQGTHRVQAGPFASRDLARSRAGQFRDELGITPLVVERR